MMLPPPRFALLTWLLLSLTLAGCGGSDHRNNAAPEDTLTFMHDGLEGQVIHQLYEYEGRIYAASSDGVYSKPHASAQWQPLGLQGTGVTDLVVFNSRHLLASTLAGAASQPHMMESLDGGSSWQSLHSDYQPWKQSADWQLLAYDEHLHTLYALSDRQLLASPDEGRDWQPLAATDNFMPLFIRRHPLTGEFWTPGYENSTPVLQVWSAAFDRVTGRYPITPRESRVFDLLLSPVDPAHLLVSGSQGIWRSRDQGQSWTLLLSPPAGRLYASLARDPHNHDLLYTGSRDPARNNQPLIFEVSRDQGDTWAQYHYPASHLRGGVRCLLAVAENHRTLVYLGLDGGGIMKVVMPLTF